MLSSRHRGLQDLVWDRPVSCQAISFAEIVKNMLQVQCNQQPTIQKTTIIDVVRRDNLVKMLETKIETLQDELDSHNATKTI